MNQLKGEKNSMERVIKVKGKAIHYVKPDMQRLEFDFSQVLEKYEKCLETFDKMHKAIHNSFKKQGSKYYS